MTIMRLMLFICFCLLVSCGSNKSTAKKPSNNLSQNLNVLSLGDSYTIGESVCETCRFPVLLQESLKSRFGQTTNITLDIIAKTGWTTTNLINAINEQKPSSEYDLVTLLIGVNNQYQGKSFLVYEEEFPVLVNRAIEKAKGDSSKVIVVSIPDYAFTPFGQSKSNSGRISQEIDLYNRFAKTYCDQNAITFVNITDITRNGLNNPKLVASDGLHPSEFAYSKFVKRLLPVSLEKIL